MHFAVQDLDHLLAIYGYWAVLVFVATESTGIPFPGETMLLAAAIYAGSTHHLSILLVVMAAAAGAIIGDNFGYLVGREGGYRLLRRFGRLIRVREREMKLGQFLFMQHGGKVVFFGRFVSILRTYAAFLAGVNRMHYRQFFFFNATGGILWACLYGFGGYVLGRNVNRFAGPVGIVVGIIAAIAIIAFLIFLRSNFVRLADEAERKLPGSLDQHSGGETLGGKPVKQERSASQKGATRDQGPVDERTPRRSDKNTSTRTNT